MENPDFEKELMEIEPDGSSINRAVFTPVAAVGAVRMFASSMEIKKKITVDLTSSRPYQHGDTIGVPPAYCNYVSEVELWLGIVLHELTHLQLGSASRLQRWCDLKPNDKLWEAAFQITLDCWDERLVQQVDWSNHSTACLRRLYRTYVSRRLKDAKSASRETVLTLFEAFLSLALAHDNYVRAFTEINHSRLISVSTTTDGTKQEIEKALKGVEMQTRAHEAKALELVYAILSLHPTFHNLLSKYFPPCSPSAENLGKIYKNRANNTLIGARSSVDFDLRRKQKKLFSSRVLHRSDEEWRAVEKFAELIYEDMLILCPPQPSPCGGSGQGGASGQGEASDSNGTPSQAQGDGNQDGGSEDRQPVDSPGDELAKANPPKTPGEEKPGESGEHTGGLDRFFEEVLQSMSRSDRALPKPKDMHPDNYFSAADLFSTYRGRSESGSSHAAFYLNSLDYMKFKRSISDVVRRLVESREVDGKDGNFSSGRTLSGIHRAATDGRCFSRPVGTGEKASVAILFDASGSMAKFAPRYLAAAKALYEALSGPFVNMRVWIFGSRTISIPCVNPNSSVFDKMPDLCSTVISPAIREASAWLKNEPGDRRKLILIFSDGESESVSDLMIEQRNRGVRVLAWAINKDAISEIGRSFGPSVRTVDFSTESRMLQQMESVLTWALE